MLKNGPHVIYNNLGYKLTGYDDDGRVKIVSFNSNDLNNGFTRIKFHPNGIGYYKYVNRSEITAGYSIVNRCMYKGYEF